MLGNWSGTATLATSSKTSKRVYGEVWRHQLQTSAARKQRESGLNDYYFDEENLFVNYFIEIFWISYWNRWDDVVGDVDEF